MTELIPKFEQSSGHKVLSDLDGTIGAMTDRVKKSEAADVPVLAAAAVAPIMPETSAAPAIVSRDNPDAELVDLVNQLFELSATGAGSTSSTTAWRSRRSPAN